jgi:hypothetical protein
MEGGYLSSLCRVVSFAARAAQDDVSYLAAVDAGRQCSSAVAALQRKALWIIPSDVDELIVCSVRLEDCACPLFRRRDDPQADMSRAIGSHGLLFPHEVVRS